MATSKSSSSRPPVSDRAGPVRLRRAWTEARERLVEAAVEDAWLEAEVLARHVLGIDRSAFYSRLADEISAGQASELRRLVGRRTGREPLAYIIGVREFYGMDFAVSPDVLVPRQESELLVELALERIGELTQPRVLDVGTGSGCIALAISANAPGAVVHAIEASEGALAIAERNRRTHGLDGRVAIHHGRYLAPVIEAKERFDLIVCNPPYIPSAVLGTLPDEVRAEPAMSLDGGPDGLGPTRTLLSQAPSALSDGGRLLVEIYSDSARRLAALSSRLFPEIDVALHDDLLGLARVLEVGPLRRS